MMLVYPFMRNLLSSSFWRRCSISLIAFVTSSTAREICLKLVSVEVPYLVKALFASSAIRLRLFLKVGTNVP
jgi:hypothetical protein